jgi:hypothetical protein
MNHKLGPFKDLNGRRDLNVRVMAYKNLSLTPFSSVFPLEDIDKNNNIHVFKVKTTGNYVKTPIRHTTLNKPPLVYDLQGFKETTRH